MHRAVVESLETRQMLSTSVLTYHNDTIRDGVNSTETTLSPANVKEGSFGKLYTVALDGNAYAEPLVVPGETITAGANTVGTPGVYTVVYVETQNDSVYAVDTISGAVLWKRSFLSLTTGATAGTDVNNPLGAALLTAPTSAEVDCTDITPTYGITGTPVIDLATNRMYVVAFTKEIVGGVATFVQRIHALSLSDGTDQVTPYTIGTTTGTNTNTTSIYVYGSGDGSIVDPYNNTGNSVVQFNALRENQRAALSLVNGVLYISYASHCDNFPYHGWIVSWNVSSLATTGWNLNGVFCTSPNGGGAGIWGGGGALTFDPDEAGVFYFETGNGFGQGDGITLNSAGYPNGGAYFEAAVKITADTTTSPTNQNMNGWGFKVLDYFIPYNQAALDNVDEDLGSGSPLALPDSAGIAGHPRLLIVSGKQGVIYVIDRDNMGHYNPVNDNVINSVPNGNGDNTPPTNITGSLSTPVFFNNTLYFVSGYSGDSVSFTISSTGTLVPTSQTTVSSFGYLPGSPVLSSNGTQSGIIWQLDRNTNELHAYDANTYNTELWNSGQKPNSGDAVGTVNKITTPTVANGEVFVGTANTLVAYGLTPPVSATPQAPVLGGTALSGTSVNLTWSDPTYGSNVATAYSIEELINGTWTVINTAPGGTLSLAVGGLTLSTTYSFRMRGLNGLGYSAYSNVASITTTSQTAVIDYSGGFGGSLTGLQFNGNADVIGSRAELTANEDNQAGSFFSSTPVNVSQFSTTFTFQQSGGSQIADGMTFTIQSQGVTALGSSGGGLGYGTDGSNGGAVITNSIAIKFDVYNNAGEGTNSTGLYLDGATPTVPSVDISPSGINLHSGDIMQCLLAYNGSSLTETLTDTVTGAVFSTSYTINLLNYTGSVAYVGFTGGTGGETTAQDILAWKFVPAASAAPAAPSALGAVPASATSVGLSWNNNATNENGYLLDRATDPAFTQNLITETLPSSPASFTDSAIGLASGGTYYYRIRATNSAGTSANSNVAMVTIPFAPARASNPVFDSVTTTSITMHWTDNAGTNAIGYHIMRSVSGGAYSLYTTLPNSPTSTPTEYDWTDTGCTPGTYYDYHIEAFNVAGYNDFVGGNASTLTVAPTGLTAVANTSSISLTWTAVAGAVNYNIYRGSAAGAESTTPIATGITALTFTDTAAPKNAVSFYTVTAVNSNTAPLNGESAPSNETSASIGLAAVQLTGTPIGTQTSWSNYNDTIAQVFDNNFSTFFDAPNSSLTNWVGLDLGYAQTITQIKFAPRIGLEFRSVGGVFQVSSTPDFSSNVLTVATITATPVSGVLTTINVNPGGAYRYVRYTGGTQWVNIAEMQVWGPPTAPPTFTKLTGTVIGTQTSYSNYNDTIAQVFDGNFSTFFDAPNSSLTNWVGLDLGYAQNISEIKFAPRPGLEFRMLGGQFQVSSTADFSSNVVTVGTIMTTPVAGQFTTMFVSPGAAYRYVRYVGGTSWVNIAEMEVDGIPTAPPSYTLFTGTPIGTAGSYNNIGNTIANVFDGSLTTFFDPPNGSLTNWVGLDLGYPQTISQINYAPRSGLEFRMVGGQFQASSVSDFSSNVVTLGTVLTAPVAGQFTTMFVNPGAAYRYVRYIGGTQWVNIAEMQVEGIPGTAPAFTKLTGTAIGTAGSYNNVGNTIANVFDGNLTSFFDPPTGALTDWVGLDLGSAQTITQIKYAPRAGYEYRMVGGQFQVSSTADFSSNVVTIYTILNAPVAGVFTTVSVTPGAAYRYIRYVGGTQWVNIAEMEVDTST
jgi:hypothetical protein